MDRPKGNKQAVVAVLFLLFTLILLWKYIQTTSASTVVAPPVSNQLKHRSPQHEFEAFLNHIPEELYIDDAVQKRKINLSDLFSEEAAALKEESHKEKPKSQIPQSKSDSNTVKIPKKADINKLDFPPRTFEDMRGHKFLFLCGLSAGDTLVLYDHLLLHPEVSALHRKSPKDEGRYHQTVYPDEVGIQGIIGVPQLYAEGHITEEQKTLANKDAGLRLFTQWAPLWNLDRKYLMETSSTNFVRARMLQAMFPDSYFVFVLRHPIPYVLQAVHNLKMYKRWNSQPLNIGIISWLQSYRWLAEDLVKIKNYALVSYEDMNRQPDVIFQKIRQFMHVSDSTKARPTKKQDRPNGVFYEMWRRRLKGKKETHQGVVKGLVAQYEDQVVQCGYSLVNLTFGPTSCPPIFSKSICKHYISI